MSTPSFIPNGRTSRVKKDGLALQVQTEYAFRPYPRLTTTILNDGQVIHKIEKKLDRPVGSVEEQSEMEQLIKRQHSEVVSVIKEKASASSATLQEFKESASGYISLSDRLRSIAGVQSVYELDNEGNFCRQDIEEKFRKAYSALFKGLKDLIEVFAAVPGLGMTRERGVYEVERERLYLVSCGDEICVVTVKRGASSETNYEQTLRQTLEDFFQQS
ncbi:MAG: hypothetical protein JSW34_04100 [Candidatus Zixiibacteriota bacterium]|nr:MAG: hypothetical protein JSW34_04100 [candidate division Zixibacteria bacterium]